MYGSQIMKMGFRKAILDGNERRKAHSRHLLDMYDDVQLDMLEAHIQKLYGGKRAADDLLPVTLNIVKKITDRLSLVYVRDAVRVISNGTDTDQSLFSEFEQHSGLGIKLKQSNRISTLTGNALMRVLWRNGKAEIDLYFPDEYDITCGDSPEDILSVRITKYDDDNKKYFVLWSAETISHLNHNGHLIKQEENPYNCLPFIHIFKQSPVSVYWQNGLNSLASAQQACNLLITELFYVLRLQGFGLGVIIGGKANTQDALGIGPNSFLRLPEGGKFSFEGTQAPIGAYLDSLDFVGKQQAILHGLPADAMSSSPTDSSGLSKIVSSGELIELRQDQLCLYGRYERQIFELWRTIHNYHSVQKVSGQATLTVNFHDPKPVISPLEMLNEQEKLLELGLISPIDILMQRDPDLTREQAQIKLLQIRDDIQEFNKISSF